MAYREFLDGGGNAWTVWDTYPDPARLVDMEELRDGWLTFRSGAQLRRLLPVPVGWSEQPDETLRHWLELAVPVKPRLDPEADVAMPRRPATPAEEPPLLRHPAPDHGDPAHELAEAVARSHAMLERFRAAAEGREHSADAPEANA